MTLAPAHAGAWPKAPGERLMIETAELFAAEAEDRRFEQIVARSYLEYGLTDMVTLGGKLAHADQQAEGPGYIQQADGLSEAELFGVYHFQPGARTVSAVRLSGALPTTKFSGAGRAMGSDAAIELAFLRGTGGDRWFAEGEAGYRRSLGGDADFLRLDAVVGVKRGRAMVLVESLNKKAVLPKSASGNDFDLSQFGLSAVVPVRERMSLQLGARFDSYTRQIDPGTSLFFSFWWRQ